MGDDRRLWWTVISVAVAVAVLLMLAWAADVDRRIDTIDERQRDVLIRLQALERDRNGRWPLGQ